MNSFEFNKMAGALLGALLLTMVLGIVSDALFYHAPPAKPGYPLPVATAAPAAKAPAQKAVPLATLLAKASPAKGKADMQVCQACHNLEKGAGPKVGPPLWNVLGRKVASFPGFDYSDALKKKGGTWTFSKVFAFIRKPSAYAPGTKMGFAGEPNPQKRADILSYLRTLSDHPQALPKPAPAAATPAKSATAAPAAVTPKANPAPASPAAPAAVTPKANLAPAAATPAPAAAPKADALAVLLAKASPAKGKADMQVCQACHNLEKGAGPKVGPPLWNVLGRKVASFPGFDYSDALKKKGGTWTFSKVFAFIRKPSAYAPGTLMGFSGEPNPQKRADILSYLRTLSDHPLPLPKAASAAAPAPAPGTK